MGDQTTFERECTVAVSALKSALIELFDAGQADYTRPQEVARRLGINKTLTWSISRFIESPEAVQAVAFVPGASTVERVAAAFPASSRIDEAKLRVGAAAQAMDEMIQRHAGDRATLELILDNAAEENGQLELSRKLAFRGSSGIAGVQALTRLSTWMAAPSATHAGMLDLVCIRGYSRVRRLRSQMEWTIFRVRRWGGDMGSQETIEPLDPSADLSMPLMPEFNSGPVPTINISGDPRVKDFVLRSGPVGNSGAFDVFAGEIMRNSVPRYATEADPTGEFSTLVAMPVESLVMDLVYHTSLTPMGDARAMVFSETPDNGTHFTHENDPKRLPINVPVLHLAGSPPAVATPLVPRYAEIVSRAFSRTGWNPSEFKATRVEIKFPPLNSLVSMRFGLESRPAE